MTMPEAPVDENDGLVTRKHKIWFPRKILYMQAIAKAESVQASANQELRFGVLTPYFRHYLAPFFRRHRVGHSASLTNRTPF